MAAMISDLEATSDTAFDLLKPRCEHMFDELRELMTGLDEALKGNAEEEEE